MKVVTTERGFQGLEHDARHGWLLCVSGAIAWQKYADAFDRPGSSFLWVGDRHHLDRDEVRELVGYLQRWLETGSLREAEASTQ